MAARGHLSVEFGNPAKPAFWFPDYQNALRIRFETINFGIQLNRRGKPRAPLA
jgi:hypothetical protein